MITNTPAVVPKDESMSMSASAEPVSPLVSFVKISSKRSRLSLCRNHCDQVIFWQWYGYPPNVLINDPPSIRRLYTMIILWILLLLLLLMQSAAALMIATASSSLQSCKTSPVWGNVSHRTCGKENDTYALWTLSLKKGGDMWWNQTYLQNETS